MIPVEYQIIGGLDAEYLEALKERFWDKVDKQAGNGCWEWTASRNLTGYGHFGVLGLPSQVAHRVSYELNVGPIPAGYYVCHHCDNPPCIRPDHLFTGTNGDNVRDAIEKGRWKSHRANSKFTDETIEYWRNHFDPKKHVVARIAKGLGVTPATVRNFLRGETYQDVPGTRHVITTTFYIDESEKKALFDAYKQGIPIPDIAADLDMHQASAYRLISEYVN